jgi:leader peptidase (prepilin peptidase)/N-methyltransferase
MLLSFLFGLAVGSFINVLVFRLGPVAEGQESNFFQAIRNRSHCDFCRKTLQWYELIPVFSFLVQKGRCRACQQKLSWQYPLVELLAGLSFALVYWRLTQLLILKLSLGYLFFAYLVLWWLIISALIAISVFDFKYYLIPSFLLYFLVSLSFGINLFYFLNSPLIHKTGVYFSGSFFYLLGQDSWLIRLIPGVLFSLVTIGLAFLLSRGRAMGFGDVLLVFGLGLVFGWPDILGVLIFSFVLGTIISLVLIGFKKKTLKDIVPFGPFLALGAMTMLLFGDKILSAYLNLFPNLFF